MIYEAADRDTALKPLGDLTTQRLICCPEREHRLAGTIRNVALAVLSIPILPFLIIWSLVRAFLSVGRTIERFEQTWRNRESAYGFDLKQVAADGEYDERTGTAMVRLNNHALRGLAGTLKDLIAPAQAASEGEPEDPRREEMLKPGWHTHSDLFFNPLPVEITVGLSEGLLRLTDGVHLSASPEHWVKLADCWLRVADEQGERLIVLDRYQQDWCDPKSTGRFVIEYKPDFQLPDEEESARHVCRDS